MCCIKCKLTYVGTGASQRRSNMEMCTHSISPSSYLHENFQISSYHTSKKGTHKCFKKLSAFAPSSIGLKHVNRKKDKIPSTTKQFSRCHGMVMLACRKYMFFELTNKLLSVLERMFMTNRGKNTKCGIFQTLRGQPEQSLLEQRYLAVRIPNLGTLAAWAWHDRYTASKLLYCQWTKNIHFSAISNANSWK